MRLIMISTLFPDATRPQLGTFVEKRALTLMQRDHVELRVIAPVGLPPLGLKFLSHYRKPRQVPKFENWLGLNVIRPRFAHIPGVGGRYDPALFAMALRPVIKAIRKDFPFDLIDAEYFFPDGVAATRLSQSFDTPVSVTARGGDIHYWGARGKSREQILDSSKHISGMVAVSNALRDDMVKMGMDKNRIEVIHPGVEHQLFYPKARSRAKASLNVTGKLVVSVATLDDNKGQYLVIDALMQVPDVHYWIAGEGPKRNKLERKVQSLGLQNRVRFLGGIDRDAVSRLLAAADIMVLPSQNEGFCNAWLEALAAGTPIIICNAGGAAEAVQLPEQGRIVARDAVSIANAIREVLTCDYDRTLISQSVSHLTWQAKGEKLSSHYQRLIANYRRH